MRVIAFRKTDVLAVTALAAASLCAQAPQETLHWSEIVGRDATNHVVLPVNQVLTPAGKQIELPGLRPQVLALSPDGKLLVTSGKKRNLVVMDPDTGNILQKVDLPDDGPLAAAPAPTSSHYLKPDKNEQASFTGLVFSPDGSRLYFSNVKGSIKVFAVDSAHHLQGLGALALPDANAPKRKAEIPAGLAVSRDGRRLYVVGNLSNRLLELELPSGALLRTFEVGAVPYEVVLTQRKAYVSNWGGRRPDATSETGPAGQGTFVRTDASSAAEEGSVSVIDLEQGRVVREILTGRHACALQLTPDGRHLCVANASSDTISVLATASDQVVDTIPVRWQAQDLFGASPNALAMDAKGKTLFVCNGRQNAIAVFSFRPAKSKLLGLIPTGWYPGAIVSDAARKSLYVANVKGTLPDCNSATHGKGFNSRQHLGSVSLIRVPDKSELKKDTVTVLRNYRRAVEEHVFAKARAGRPPQPVPERVGEPSVFKHVVYFIKENRTYDQVLGDLKEGNGHPELCIFGEKVTPNQHKMVREFVLLDNLYCCGILSADGHQWADSAFATDYLEKQFADFPRCYPDMQEADGFDAMAYSPCGFIWDNALRHGLSVRDYGEATVTVTAWKDPTNHTKLGFLDHYGDFMNQAGRITYSNYTWVRALQTNLMRNTVGWDTSVPDVFRAAQFLSEFRQFEARGEMPHLILIFLPNDHTSGTGRGKPTPAAQVADNDLAFGRIVEAISHSRFWKDTCMFAIEDDPQSGWDHVSGYRTTGYVISPYTRRRAVVSLNYNQTSILRTIELMLGLPPMNQMDATATPMTACFSDQPDFTPFDSVTNNIPLDQMNPRFADIKDRRQLRDAVVSSRLPLDQPDRCPEAVLNQILWRAQMGFDKPYPQWAVTAADKD